MGTSTGHGTEKEFAELDARQRRAWTTYSESLKGLEGQEYNDAEDRSWERLQRKLKDLDVRRRQMVTQTSTRPSTEKQS